MDVPWQDVSWVDSPAVLPEDETVAEELGWSSAEEPG